MDFQKAFIRQPATIVYDMGQCPGRFGACSRLRCFQDLGQVQVLASKLDVPHSRTLLYMGNSSLSGSVNAGDAPGAQGLVPLKPSGPSALRAEAPSAVVPEQLAMTSFVSSYLDWPKSS